MEAGEIPKALVGWEEKIKKIVKAVAGTFSSQLPEIPLEKINERTVTEAILNAIIGSLPEKLREVGTEFSCPDILVSMGYYIFPEAGNNYPVNFSEAYQKTRNTLNELVTKGVLGSIQRGKPDINGETIHYRVVNQDSLRNIVAAKI